MKFDRVYETLGMIEKQDGVTIEDALDLFYDFYEDVKTVEGNVLEQQPIGDRDEVIGRLCWMARMVARLYSRNEQALDAPESLSRWEKAREKLSAAQERLDAREEEATRRTAELQALLAQLKQREEEKRQELLRQQEAVDELDGRLKEYEGQIDGLKGRLSELGQKIPGMQEKKKALAAETEKVRRQYEDSLREAEEAAGLLEQVRHSYEGPLHGAEEKALLLTQCMAAWKTDSVLQERWPFDKMLVKEIERELEEAKRETEDALEKYRKQYRALVACLEKGGNGE